MSYSTPSAITSLNLETPSPYLISTSANLNGGATLFFTILTRVLFPIISLPSFKASPL